MATEQLAFFDLQGTEFRHFNPLFHSESSGSVQKGNNMHLLTDMPATLRLVTAYVAQGLFLA
jgi:hypothetical protein